MNFIDDISQNGMKKVGEKMKKAIQDNVLVHF